MKIENNPLLKISAIALVIYNSISFSYAEQVSADTKIASVGFRPRISSAIITYDKNDITNSQTIISINESIEISSVTTNDPDNDPVLVDTWCSVSIRDEVGNEKIILPTTKCTDHSSNDASIPISIQPEYANHFLIIDLYAKTDSVKTNNLGYNATPDISNKYRVISAQPISPTKAEQYEVAYAYIEASGRKLNPDRLDISTPHDDNINLSSAFPGAKIKIFAHGGVSPYRFNSLSSYARVDGSSIGPDSADIVINESIINSSDGTLRFSIIDATKNVVNFSMTIDEIFLSNGKKESWDNSKKSCEDGGYIFPHFSVGVGEGAENGSGVAESLFFWGSYLPYGFPNVTEKHWTASETGRDKIQALSLTLDRTGFVPSYADHKQDLQYFLCKKVY